MTAPIRSASSPNHENERAFPFLGTLGAILLTILFLVVSACGDNNQYSPTGPTGETSAAEAPSGRSDTESDRLEDNRDTNSNGGDDGSNDNGGSTNDGDSTDDTGSTDDGSSDSDSGSTDSGDSDTGSTDSGDSTDGSDSGSTDSGDSTDRDGSTDDSGSTDSGTADYPNLPAEFSSVTETSYAAPSEGGFSSSTNENFAIVDDAAAPRSASKVARATFPAGLSDGSSPIWSEASISGHSVRRLYLSFWVKVSDNWQAHSTGVNKVAIAWTHQKPVAVANILGTGSGRLGSQVRIQDTPDGARNLDPNQSDPEIVRGRWHQWEVLLVSNTGDAADGEIHWWVDGQKAGTYTDVRFGTSDQSKIWDYATWRPVWGGRGDTVGQTMHMWMDHYYVAGAR